MNTKSVIKNFLTNNISKVVSVVLLTFFTVIFKIMNPIFMKLIIDNSIKGPTFSENSTTVIIFTVLLGVSTVLSLIFDAIRQSENIKFGNSITTELRSSAFQVAMKSELYEISKISKDELSETIIDSTHVIGDVYISSKILKLSYNALFLFAMIIAMFAFNSLFAFITCLTLPLFYLSTKYLGKLKNKRTSIYTKSKESHEYLIKDHLEQLKTIKVRNGLNEETVRYNKVLKENKKNYIKEVYTDECNKTIVPTIFVSISWFILFLLTCVELYNSNDYTWLVSNLGSIVACVSLSPKVYSTFKVMLDIHYTEIAVEQGYEKLDKIFNTKIEFRSETIPSLEEVHSLKFNSVSFDYSNYGLDDKVNLDKIDFEIKKGEKLGIIGLPGSGKTTIADLITKIIRPKQGNVLINNCDINKLNTTYLRDIVTCVPQNYQLLNTSIEDNITYPLPLDEYKYNDSLNKCKLKDLIFSLPDRDSTNARKAKLSSSDIQKIAMANAFYKDSPIILLDDATSKLDPVTEDEIMNEFFKLKNKISIVISNRINSVAKCDKVLIISNGKVSEYGRVDELLANKNSAFARMTKDAHLQKKVV